MQFSMERWFSAAEQRFSVRSYRGGPDEEAFAAVCAAGKALSARGVRIAVARSEKAFTSPLGGYGKIRGTDCFAAFITKEGNTHNVGYIGEAFILECTALGLGTCWLGLSYNKNHTMRALALEDGERISCVTPIGLSAEEYVGRPRKALTKLTGLAEEQLRELPEWQQHALACARIAPSAINAQPWHFLVQEGGIAVTRTSTNFGYGSLDCGIAMLHVELGAAHSGVFGEWEAEGDIQQFRPIGACGD